MNKASTHYEGTHYPPSVQNDLIQYLNPGQQKKMCAILSVLKKKAQDTLAVLLLDYLETGQPVPPEDGTLSIIYWHIINTELIRPLRGH